MDAVFSQLPGSPPVVYFDTRERLPSFAWSAVLQSARWGPTYLVKPRGREDVETTNLTLIDPGSLRGLREQIQAFRSNYVHLSTAPVAYERACFERFIALNALCDQLDLPSIWHVDTDVVVSQAIFAQETSSALSHLDLVAWGVPHGAFSFGEPMSLGFSFVTKEVLQAFTNFVVDKFYVDYLGDCEKFYRNRLSAGMTGGVCDMTAWGVLSTTHAKWRVLDTRTSRLAGRALINTLYSFSRQSDIPPAVQIEGTGRYSLRLNGGDFLLVRGERNIPLLGVHFAGADKALIPTVKPTWSLPIGGPRHLSNRGHYRLRRKIGSLAGRRASMKPQLTDR